MSPWAELDRAIRLLGQALADDLHLQQIVEWLSRRLARRQRLDE